MLLIKVFLTENACNIVLRASKHESITIPNEFIFVSVPKFNGAISSKNRVRNGWGKGWKKSKKVGLIERQGLLIDRGLQAFRSLGI